MSNTKQPKGYRLGNFLSEVLPAYDNARINRAYVEGKTPQQYLEAKLRFYIDQHIIGEDEEEPKWTFQAGDSFIEKVANIRTRNKLRRQQRRKLRGEARENTDKVDRLEVIDETGRVYVKGSIYGSPVEVKLSFQDDDRTLKVFVNEKKKPHD